MKKGLLYVLMVLLSVQVVLADRITDTIGNVFKKIIWIGDLSWLGATDQAISHGFMRILIWILVYTILFAGSSFVSTGREEGINLLSRSQSIVVAAIIATITTIFLPPTILLAVGAGWSTLLALVLVGGPIVGVAYLLYLVPGEGQPETKKTVVLKLIVIAVLFWVLTVMIKHLGGGV